MLEKLLKIGRDSNSKVKRKFINWFIRRYYACEIDCASKISDSVKFPHNGFGVVVSPYSEIGDNVSIFPGSKLVVTGGVDYTPVVEKNVIIGANATIVGKITIGENSIIAAGAVVTKNVPNDSTVYGINKICPSKEATAKVLHNNNNR